RRTCPLCDLGQVILLLRASVHCSPLPETHSPHLRMKRMTPFWRGVSLRPIGASCRDNSECITLLCRYRPSSPSFPQER
uniref:Liver-expressed antimicrobial peptide 2 n=1 Tax=Ornithorhynchus anatinus TaxID=9258 RepID=A0A6I8P176_ORNAN